ncbi:hypothetical protein N9L47_04315 [Rhodobacteraceae bacterium]|nr:hypothetical protein [Paracoccaceae bacterium]
MALGAMMFSMPTAMLTVFFISFLNGLGAGEGFALYATVGALSLFVATLVNGYSRD